MTAVTLDSNDPRSLRALELTAASDTWLSRRTDQGEVAYGIPSQRVDGQIYTVTPTSCDCEDAHYSGLSRGRIGEGGLHTACKHQIAVRLYEVLVKAQALRHRDR